MDLGDSFLAYLSTLTSCYNTYFGLNPSSDLPDSTLTAEGDPPDKNWKKIVSSGLHFASMVGSFCPLPLRLSQGLNLGTSLLSLGTNVSDIYERRSYYQEHKLEMAAALFQAGLSVYYALNTTGPQLKAHNEAGLPKDRIRVPDFPDKPVPSYRTKELVAKLEGGRSFDRMVVIVHPEKGDQTMNTINFLRSSSELEEAPRVLLLGAHRMQNVDYYYPGLKREVTLIAKSEEGLLGECGLTLLADEIHLAGGRYGLCFAKAIKDLVSQFRQTAQTQIRLHVHRSLVWHDPTGRTLGEDGISSFTSMKWLMRARHGYTFPILPTIEENFWQRVLGRADEYVCVLPDGKKVFVVFET